MAVSGLHNVPDFAWSGEPLKRDPGRWDGDHCRRSTTPSTLFQMWREIEGEHSFSQSYRSRQQRNGSDSECRSTVTSVGDRSENVDAMSQVSNESENQGFSGGSESEHEDNNSVISEQSSDFREIERERVRQIFREWLNSSPKRHPSDGFNSKNRARKCVGDTESERVRILRERAPNTSQQRSGCASSGEGGSEVASQTVQVGDRLVINHTEFCARRPLRRLYGRQTLLDLLVKAQSERKRELLCLSEQKPVSNFAYHNRIQALLRGRFLRNGSSAVDERPYSVAATELGFLRQRQTVSDLREGFLSKLDNAGSASMNSAGSISCYNDGNKGEGKCTCTEGTVTGNHIAADLESTTVGGNCNTQDLEVIDEAEEPVLVDERSPEDVSVCAESASGIEELVLVTEARQHGACSRAEDEDMNLTFRNESLLESADIDCSGSFYKSTSGETSVHEVDDNTTGLEGNTNEEFNSYDASPEEYQGSVTAFNESMAQNVNTVAFTEWADSSRQNSDRSWQERASSQSFPGPSGNNVEEQDQMQESYDWLGHDCQEAIDSWRDMPSSEAGESVREVATAYFPDDDKVNTVELRELFRRRCVSSLLHSSFRESLNHVLQSHMERLGHASVDWEPDSASFPPHIEQDPEQVDSEQSLAPSERNSFMQSSTLFEASQQLWDEDLQVTDCARHHLNQQFGTEWEVINILRIDMARLLQRMNNMKGMLEACMDLQIELQRLLHQEVSAALNRPISSEDAPKDNRVHDESQLDHVKRGICCVCQHSKIDSLLYRCGHMCTCTNCAENLVQSHGKCPMCCAPAVEAVRAFFIQ
ncbi:uncharacterized protein LOC125219487 [Salvia hispanica]|uniref:uncharacterized protein LOC125219487 n=1 Tax=Salvia hispanica TaxID=49212 RepID=UPI002009B839|nr:uncharacterized protein LOC125219487 [Salvia hispanica]XP_047977429.1 uncharacterized protein LOC125219487 [Salvia hispanica]